jgi:Na+/H+ antiporter NhaD/arsenite permease-like protein
MIVFVGIMWLAFGRGIEDDANRLDVLATVDPAAAITDRPLMVRALIVLSLTLVGFLFHSLLGLEAATIALLGATVLMMVGPLDPHAALRDIEWSTLFFFVGLFMLIEAVVHVGIVGGIADVLADAAGGNLAVATMGVLWFSALASAIVDNIPYTATAIPIVERLIEGGLDGDVLWWALALGACLGGNLTIVGASANIVVANLAGRDGHPITFMQFFRFGLGVVMASLLISTVYLWVRYL